MSESNETSAKAIDLGEDCPLPVAIQNRNITCFATFWALFYLAAPVSYVGLTHANLLKDLGNNDTVSNLPSAVYMWLTVVPILAAWFFPQPRYLKRLACSALFLMALVTTGVAFTLWLSNSARLATVVVIAHGAIFGAANGVSLTTLWDLLRRGVSTSRRGKALGFAYGIGPLFACVGSLLQDALFNGKLTGGRTFGLEFPTNYIALFVGVVPMLLLSALAIAIFVVPESNEAEFSRESIGAEIRSGLQQFVRNRFVLYASLLYVLVYSGHEIMSNASLHADDPDTVGLQNFLRFGCKAVAGALLGWLLAKASPRATVAATTLILLAGMAWALGSSGWWYMATFGIMGAGELFGAHFPNYVASASSKTYVRINMAYLSVLGALSGFSPVLFGLISDYFDRVASFYVATAMLGLALILIFVLLPQNPTPREEEEKTETADERR